MVELRLMNDKLILYIGGNIMTKCDFCTQSMPNGKCFWYTQAAREDDCKKAIEKMIEAFKNSQSKNEKE